MPEGLPMKIGEAKRNQINQSGRNYAMMDEASKNMKARLIPIEHVHPKDDHTGVIGSRKRAGRGERIHRMSRREHTVESETEYLKTVRWAKLV